MGNLSDTKRTSAGFRRLRASNTDGTQPFDFKRSKAMKPASPGATATTDSSPLAWSRWTNVTSLGSDRYFDDQQRPNGWIRALPAWPVAWVGAIRRVAHDDDQTIRKAQALYTYPVLVLVRVPDQLNYEGNDANQCIRTTPALHLLGQNHKPPGDAASASKYPRRPL